MKKESISIFLFLLFFAATIVSGKTNMHIGDRDRSFGSHGQANAILALMNQQPGKSAYQISYNTPVDVVVFGCDLEKEILIRVHQDSKGRGTAESWHGDIMYRLNQAANGGSLNDTKNGKNPGTFETF